MNDLDWHQAEPITFEHLRSNYSFGDLVFSGFVLTGVLDGVLHLSSFRPEADVEAELFVLFKDIRKINQDGEVSHPVFRYDVDIVDTERSIKKLTLQFDTGSTIIEYKDDLLGLCRLPSGEFTKL